MMKYLAAATVAIIVFAFSAFAASLTVHSGTLQAGQDSIGTCAAPDVRVTYGEPELDVSTGTYLIDELRLQHDADAVDGQSACTGYAFRVTVTGGSGILARGSGTFGPGVNEVELDQAFDAEQSTDVHVIVGDLPTE
jgi:hypothetical protein